MPVLNHRTCLQLTTHFNSILCSYAKNILFTEERCLGDQN